MQNKWSRVRDIFGSLSFNLSLKDGLGDICGTSKGRQKERALRGDESQISFFLFLPSFLWSEVHHLPLSLHAVPPELNDRGILNTEPPSLGCFSTFDSFKKSQMDPTGPGPASTVEQLKSAVLKEVQCGEGLRLYHYIPDLNFTEPKLVFS